MKHYIGMDIGGTSTTIGLVSAEGEIVDRSVILIEGYASGPIESFLDAIADEIKAIQQRHNVSLEGIGIGAPNGNYYNGTIEYAPNMPWKDVHEVVELTGYQPHSLSPNDYDFEVFGGFYEEPTDTGDCDIVTLYTDSFETLADAINGYNECMKQPEIEMAYISYRGERLQLLT